MSLASIASVRDHRRARAVYPVINALLLAGCGTLGPEDIAPDTSAPVQTSALQYRLTDNGVGDYDLMLPWSYTNTGSAPTYYFRCGSRLEKQVTRSWQLAYAAPCPLASSIVDTIPPGTTFTAVSSVHACYEPNCAPRFEIVPIPGPYRLIPGLYAAAMVQGGQVWPGDPLPLERRRSNAFWIDLP